MRHSVRSRSHARPRGQRGVATLLIALVILVILTIIILIFSSLQVILSNRSPSQ